MSIDPQLPEQVTRSAQGVADIAERAGQEVIDVAFETVELSRQQSHDLAVDLVFRRIAEYVNPSRDLPADEVDDIADEAVVPAAGGRRYFLTMDSGDGLDHREDRVDRPANRLRDVHTIAVAGHTIVAGKWKDVLAPTATVLIEEHEIVTRREGLLPCGQGRIGIAFQFGVRTLHDVERIVVEAEQHMQSVFLDALVLCGVAAARTLATQTPAGLIHGDVMTCSKFRCRRQFERGRDGARTAAQYRNASNSCFHPEAPIWRYDRLRTGP